MDRKLIKQVLHEQAKQEIPDDMHKKLWTQLQRQLTPPRRNSARPALRLGWMTAVLVLVFVASAATYAFYQAITTSGFEPDAELVTPLNLEQTIEGVTVKLNWAYADGERIALGYTITTEDESLEAATAPFILLTDDQGHYFWPKFDVPPGSGADLTSASANFYTTLESAPESLNLSLQITAGIGPVGSTGDDADTNRRSQAWRGAWGYQARIDDCNVFPIRPEVTTLADLPVYMSQPPASFTDSGLEMVGPFDFSFSIPFTDAFYAITPDQTVEANDISMTLQSLRVTPSWVSALVYVEHFVPPLHAAQLHNGDRDHPLAGYAMFLGGNTGRCINLEYVISDTEPSGPWSLSIDLLQRDEPWVFPLAVPDFSD